MVVSSPCSWQQVRFSNEENDTQSTALQELTSEMINDMWYNRQEFDVIKHQVRSIVWRQQFLNGETPSSSFRKNNNHDDTDNISVLQRYGPHRSAYKKLVIRYTLHAQNHSIDPDFLRSVSTQFSARARALAANQGFEDYCEVYDPLDSLLGSATIPNDLVHGDDQEQNDADRSTFITKKRNRDDDDDDDHPYCDDERTEVPKRRRLLSST
ncbi:unnamed protein product [Cylindrotheca closterium]|uniref:Uncharacterized protein n=1 Tax=Cylindrotheca closterium TaxID=2856 RepID=A0AAD2FHF7_9STRA|nr:unnamed protein product [Cylindrotheca closterium]